MAVKKHVLFFTIAGFILIIDQLTKYAVSIRADYIDLKLLTIHFVKNYGIGFGLLNIPTLKWVLIITTIAIIIGILYYYCKSVPDKLLPVISFALILGGALGNLVDRVMYGFVIDFIDFHFWPAFNIADSAVSIGIILLILYFWKYSSTTSKRRKKRKV